MLEEDKCMKEDMVLDISSLSEGIYMLRISGQDFNLNRKIIKQ